MLDNLAENGRMQCEADPQVRVERGKSPPRDWKPGTVIDDVVIQGHCAGYVLRNFVDFWGQQEFGEELRAFALNFRINGKDRRHFARIASKITRESNPRHVIGEIDTGAKLSE